MFKIRKLYRVDIGYINYEEKNMNTHVKKSIITSTLFLITAAFSYANDGSPSDNVPFSRIQHIDWNLAEVKSGDSTVIIDRTNVQREIYSFRFEADRVRGRGADNLYFTRYTSGVNNSLSIGRLFRTFMAPLFEMESYSEYKYFQQLERVNRWEFHDWKLRLYTCDENGAPVVLVFIPIYK
jgi:hypothetical protein